MIKDRVKQSLLLWPLIALWVVLGTGKPSPLFAGDLPALVDRLSVRDVLLVADPEGDILYRHNVDRIYTPASTLKILTGLAALDHFGKSHRFKTEFYLDGKQNLIVKGYGDPLLISEAWRRIAVSLASRLEHFNDLIVDDSYFSPDIAIPGRGCSTNPYDAPVGALCANFNTVFYEYDPKGNIVSAEPQTPITPMARKKIPRLQTGEGRYTFLGRGPETAYYAGELLIHFLREQGVSHAGDVRSGRVESPDHLLYTHYSDFSLEEAIGKMLTYSNNFMANQILVSLGADVLGPPATLEKGLTAINTYCRKTLSLEDTVLVEGSGISRKNRTSASDMLRVLQAFSDYRHLLTTEGPVRYKSGTLAGIRARAGYVEADDGRPCFFVIFLQDSPVRIEEITGTVANHVCSRKHRSIRKIPEKEEIG